MPDETPDAISKLLLTADRCRRLAANMTDRSVIQALLQLAKECEAKVAELRQQTCG